MRKISICLLAAFAGIASAQQPLPMKTEPVAKADGISAAGRIIDPQKVRLKRNNAATAATQMTSVAPDADTWFCDFGSPTSLKDFTLINANGDDKEWTWENDGLGGGYAFITCNTDLDMDDWLVSPAIRLEAGKRYIVNIDARSTSSYYPETVALYIGKGTTVADATTEIAAPVTLKGRPHNEAQPIGGAFTPTESGDYHVMIHGCSPKDMYTLIVENIRVSSPDAIGLPGPDAVKYNEDILVNLDFSTLGGSEESPAQVLDANGNIAGFDGCQGLACYAAGGKLLVNTIENPDAQFIPGFADFKKGRMGRVEMDARVAEWGETAAMFNNMETVAYTGMAGSTDCPDGWVWGQGESDFNLNMPTDKSWTGGSYDVTLPETGNLLKKDIDYSMEGLGEYSIDRLSARVTASFGSSFYIRSYKVTELSPVIPTVTGYRFSDYSADGFTIEWNPVEGADRYVAELYAGIPSASTISNIGRKVVTSTSASFETETSDGRFLYVKIYACKGEDTRSPEGALYRVFQVNKPSFGPLQEPADGVMRVPFTVDAQAHSLEITASAGVETEEETKDFSIADFNFSGLSETAEYPYSYWLDDETGWILFPTPKFEDGAFVADNGPASWGQANFMTVEGRGLYDFSGITSPVKIEVTAKTDGDCMLIANLLQFNDDERVFQAFASESAKLTKAYDTYTFSLDPQGRKHVNIQITTYGQNVNYIKDVKVTCDLPAETVFYKPFLTGAIDLTGKNLTNGAFELRMPYDMTHIRLTGQAYRGLIDTDAEGKSTLYYNARSPLADYSDIEITPLAVDGISADADGSTPAYYNLQGIRVENPENGVFIRVSGNKAEKVIIK